MTKGFRCTDAANATTGSDSETATTIPSRIIRCIELPLENRLAVLATFRPPSWVTPYPKPVAAPAAGIFLSMGGLLSWLAKP
jgi:hypothetical protein